jgi:hypothetical protein
MMSHTDCQVYCDPLLSGSQPTLAESDNRGSSQVRDLADANNRFGCEYHCSALRLKATTLHCSEGRTFFSRAERLAALIWARPL